MPPCLHLAFVPIHNVFCLLWQSRGHTIQRLGLNFRCVAHLDAIMMTFQFGCEARSCCYIVPRLLHCYKGPRPCCRLSLTINLIKFVVPFGAGFCWRVASVHCRGTAWQRRVWAGLPGQACPQDAPVISFRQGAAAAGNLGYVSQMGRLDPVLLRAANDTKSGCSRINIACRLC